MENLGSTMIRRCNQSPPRLLRCRHFQLSSALPVSLPAVQLKRGRPEKHAMESSASTDQMTIDQNTADIGPMQSIARDQDRSWGGTVPDHLSVWFLHFLESGGLSVLLDGEADGYINVAGLLTAATDVQVIVGSFNTQKSPLMSTLKSAMSVGNLSPPD